MATAVVSGLIAVDARSEQRRRLSALAGISVDAAEGQAHGLHRRPALTANAVKAMLQYSATQAARREWRAVRRADPGQRRGQRPRRADPRLLRRHHQGAGTYWLTAGVPESTTFGGVDEPWSQSVIWGTRLVTGSSLVELNQFAWGDNIVWGTGEMDNIVVGHGERRRQHRLGHDARRRQHRVGHEPVPRQRGLRRQHRLGHRDELGRQHRLGHRAWWACSTATTSSGARCSTAPTTSCGERSTTTTSCGGPREQGPDPGNEHSGGGL